MKLALSRADLAAAIRERLTGHDRPLLIAALLLALTGVVLSFAASPAVAVRNGDAPDYFVIRHLVFLGAAGLAFAACASLAPVGVRRLGLGLLAAALALLVAVQIAGFETKGAQRWLDFGFFSLQPAEFAKPGLIIVAAWMLAERMRNPRFPALAIVSALFGMVALLLLLQPDVGQTGLLFLSLVILAFAAGVHWGWIAGALAGAAGAGVGAYRIFPHVRERWDQFFAPKGEEGYQVMRALQAIGEGGLFGKGPGEGTVKLRLPDAHADFVFAVAGEEFGLVALLGVIGLFGVLLWRGFARAQRLVEPFQQLAATGLLTLIGLQAAIHIAVNVKLGPAKGMTLPFVSYGGSSLVAAAIAFGCIVALIRRRPGALLYDTGAANARDGAFDAARLEPQP